jgi:hypothetical protein
MAYILPRAIIVLLCWGLSYGLVRIVIADESLAVFYFTGLSWALAGIVCFGYIRTRGGSRSDPPSQFRTHPNRAGRIKSPAPDPIGSDQGLASLFEHDLFRKPASTFRDHALRGAGAIPAADAIAVDFVAGRRDHHGIFQLDEAALRMLQRGFD